MIFPGAQNSGNPPFGEQFQREIIDAAAKCHRRGNAASKKFPKKS
jgi:hypothetical protein